MRETKNVVFYDAEKNKTTGNGYYTIAYLKSDPTIDQQIKEKREWQKNKNAEYKKTFINKPYNKRKNVILVNETKEIIEQPIIKQEVLPKEIKPIKSKFEETKFQLLLDDNTGNTTFILGSSKMGKSTALMRIYDQYYSGKDFVSILWTANPQIKLYEKHKNLLKSGVWNKDAEEVIAAQKKIQTGTKNKYQFCNMFDDVINVRNNTLIDNLLLTYRNSKMSSIISLQYSNLMSKCSRANCNNILCFGFNTDEAIEVVIKTFLSGYLRKQGINVLEDQINWYKDMTKDHSFIYIKPADGIVTFHKFRI